MKTVMVGTDPERDVATVDVFDRELTDEEKDKLIDLMGQLDIDVEFFLEKEGTFDQIFKHYYDQIHELDLACPGCGCFSGEGRTPGCTHPEGCGAPQ